MTQKKSKGEYQTVGVCRFCGQQRFYDWDPIDPDGEATMDCKCHDGEAYREKVKIMNAADVNINEIFAEKFPDVAETFRELKDKIYDGKIGTVTIKLPGSATARMSMPTATAIKVEYKKTTVTELSTGL
ncbi:MAG: hypothetical protein II553_04775 [Lachnospiraceae bacterium]|nr:hypothetical protein [Lachnospiraceae bacterium]